MKSLPHNFIAWLGFTSLAAPPVIIGDDVTFLEPPVVGEGISVLELVTIGNQMPSSKHIVAAIIVFLFLFEFIYVAENEK